MEDSNDLEVNENDIAVVGMAAHLPGARDVRTFWRNLREGEKSHVFATYLHPDLERKQ